MAATDRRELQDRLIKAHDRLRQLRADIKGKEAAGLDPNPADVLEQESLLQLIAELDEAIRASRWGDV
jgi:hypothetical protein